MSCKELFAIATKGQVSIDAPMKVRPRCHNRANVEVFVDGKKRKVMLVCSKCDQTIAVIRVPVATPAARGRS